jgi:cell division protein FtsB
MLKEHGSYSNFVKSEEDEQTLKKYGKYVNIGLALVTIACLIVGTYVAVLAHNLDVKNDEFQKVIKNQNEAIDALERDNNELRQMIEKNNPK